MKTFPVTKRIFINVSETDSDGTCGIRNKPSHDRSMSKMAACFICGKEFVRDQLTEHEKECLESIQTNDTSYTRQICDDSGSNISTHSVKSTHSSSSAGSDKNERRYERCYICGSDVPSYQKATHERSCKKNWELGIFNTDNGSVRKASSRSALSRAGSGSDLNIMSSGGMRKSKSVSHVGVEQSFHEVNKELSLSDRRPSSPVKPSNPSLSRVKKSLRSQSVGNISKLGLPGDKENINNTLKTPSPNWKTKSMQDVFRGIDSSDGKRRPSTPQYVGCDICGKLYSVHSIAIHKRQCERTTKLQEKAGNESSRTKKLSKSVGDLRSKSVGDLSKVGTPRTPRGQKNSSVKTSETEEKSSTVNGLDSRKPRQPGVTAYSATSSSLARQARPKSGYLTKTRPMSGLSRPDKKPLKRSVSSEFPKNVETVENSSATDVPGPNLNDDDSKVKVKGSFQKCYLCGQLYGSRSLAIHEKQCQKKFQRQAKEESRQERIKKRNACEIQLIPFGRSKSPCENYTAQPFSSTSSQSSSRTASPKSSDIGSSSFLSESPVPSTPDSLSPRSLSPVFSTSDIVTSNQNGEYSPRFVLCVFCKRPYGQHSISLHERSCKERTQEVSEEVSPRTDISDKKVSSSERVSTNLNLETADSSVAPALKVTNGDVVQLVTCPNCRRRFLSVDIVNHRQHCSSGTSEG